MESSTEVAELPNDNPMPDIERTEELRDWLNSNIKRAPRGYDDQRHEDGTPLSEEEQIGVYVNQTIDAITTVKNLGRLTDKSKALYKQSILEQLKPVEETVPSGNK